MILKYVFSLKTILKLNNELVINSSYIYQSVEHFSCLFGDVVVIVLTVWIN